ncbi:ribosome small subunit-dependent GTPase A [Candidatus Sumerlaeota bacterium]|nr:ribosome small subunit-dependent GTPase A [Candidatus Sumerlaeota bacterium]
MTDELRYDNAGGAPIALERLGWSEIWRSTFDAQPDWRGCEPGRVAVLFQNIYRVYTARGEVLAKLAGKFSIELRSNFDYPVAGDWLALQHAPGQNEAVILGRLPRCNSIARKTAGKQNRIQTMAANLDELFIFSSMNREFNPRRLERYLALARQNGIPPVVALTKTDEAEDPQSFIEQAQTAASGAPVFAVNCLDGSTLTPLQTRIADGKTIAVVGSSGVGKSTFINTLLGVERQETLPSRETDDRGRHATTHRELIPLPDGGALIDTPGIRELRVWETETDFDEAFADIEALAASCFFNDCRHDSEDGCAVKAAIEAGEIAPERLFNYRKMQEEKTALEFEKDQAKKIADNRRTRLYRDSRRKSRR